MWKRKTKEEHNLYTKVSIPKSTFSKSIASLSSLFFPLQCFLTLEFVYLISLFLVWQYVSFLFNTFRLSIIMYKYSLLSISLHSLVSLNGITLCFFLTLFGFRVQWSLLHPPAFYVCFINVLYYSYYLKTKCTIHPSIFHFTFHIACSPLTQCTGATFPPCKECSFLLC